MPTTQLSDEHVEHGLDSGRLVERYISYYGDGAVFDCSKTYGGCAVDTEPDEESGEPNPSAIIRTILPKAEYLKVWHYCRRDNSGPDPLSDAYEAAQIVAVSAVRAEVEMCGVADYWSPKECDRLGGCFLCGGDHRGL